MKFFSSISPIYFIILIGISFGISFFLYHGKEGALFSKKLKWLLISLRSLGLFLIGILFLGLFLQTFKTNVEKPILINLIDNSMSMRNYKDSASVKTEINNYLSELEQQYGQNFTIKNFTVGANTTPLNTLSFKEDKTNLSNPFATISEQFYGNNIGAVTLISDGNFNEGDHPIYTANNLNYTPVFTLAVGDTITKKDLIVRNIQSNDFVFLNNIFPVEALIEAKKIGTSSATVRLVHQGKTISSKSISTTPSTTFYKVNFEVEAKQKGVQYYQIIVDQLPGEYTYKNNQQGFYIEVIDDARKILLLASAPHPDVAAIKNVLEKEKNNQIDVKTVNEFKESATPYDLVIFHNPLSNNTLLVNKFIENNIPVLAILGAQSTFKQNQPFLGMTFNASNQLDENTPIANSNFDLFELSPETKKQLRNFPPLRSIFGKMKLSPNAKVLFYQGVGDVQKEDAQIFFHSLHDVKIGIIQGEGLWRWKLANYRTVENTEAFEEIFQKITQYLTVKKNNAPFRVNVPKKSNTNEPVLIKAEVFNASMQLTTNSTVDFKLISANKQQQTFDFSVVNNYYSLNLGKLAAGNYQWIASTKINGKLHQLNGDLVVESNQIELMDNTANYEVLSQLSTQTGGKFYPLSSYKKLVSDLRLRDDIRPVETQEQTVKNLIDYWWIILLIVILFGSEWFIKRYNGSY